jgi:broad specificity phosphatase PhoE
MRHRAVPLSPRGREQARELGTQIANVGIELAVATRWSA